MGAAKNNENARKGRYKRNIVSFAGDANDIVVETLHQAGIAQPTSNDVKDKLEGIVRDWSALRLPPLTEEEQAAVVQHKAEEEAMRDLIDLYNQFKICEEHMTIAELREYVASKGYEEGIGITEENATEEQRAYILREWRQAKIVLEVREKKGKKA